MNHAFYYSDRVGRPHVEGERAVVRLDKNLHHTAAPLSDWRSVVLGLQGHCAFFAPHGWNKLDFAGRAARSDRCVGVPRRQSISAPYRTRGLALRLPTLPACKTLAGKHFSGDVSKKIAIYIIYI